MDGIYGGRQTEQRDGDDRKKLSENHRGYPFLGQHPG